MSARRGANVLKKVKDAVTGRWLMQYSHPPFYVRPQDLAAIPGQDDLRPARALRMHPELEFDTAFYKRSQIKRQPVPGEAEIKVEPMAIDKKSIGRGPSHLTVPWWSKDSKVLTAAVEGAFVNGYTAVGVGYRFNKDEVILCGHNNDFEFFHD